MRTNFTVPEGVVVEQVGKEVIVVPAQNNEVVKLTGKAADIFTKIFHGENFDEGGPELLELTRLGVVETPRGISRRGVVTAGAIGLVVGISVIAMPRAAFAASTVLVRGLYLAAFAEAWLLRVELAALGSFPNSPTFHSKSMAEL